MQGLVFLSYLPLRKMDIPVCRRMGNRRLRHALRRVLAGVTRQTPLIRGKGRCVLLLDRFLTHYNEPSSYEVPAAVNGLCHLICDLRDWEQRFAYYYGQMEPDFVSISRQHYTRGVFYDVGASIGLYSMTFGTICSNAGAYVRAFEPIPTNIARLRDQMKLNALNGNAVRVEDVALGDREGVAEMVLAGEERTPGNAKIVAAGDFPVRVSTLDRIWRENHCEAIGFVKVDTEGYDTKVIDGGREAIRTCRPNMLVEFNRERMRNMGISLDPCWEFLTGLGYQAFRIDGHGKTIEIHEPGDFENLLFVSECAGLGGNR